MTTKSTRTFARIIEIANYILLIPATTFVFAFVSSLFRNGIKFSWLHPDMLIYSLVPAVFYLLGLALHLLYFQISRGRPLFLSLPLSWGLSTLFNLVLTSYFVFFGSFAAWMLIWTLCVAVLSLIAFVATYRTRPIPNQGEHVLES